MAEAKTQSLKSAILDSVPGIQHGFGVRAEPLPLVFSATWEARRWRGKQVHGTQAVELREPGQDAGETDAVMTWELGIPAAVQTADCVPVLLARQDGRAVAAVHAGWRGARARILARLWEKLHLRGEEPRQWVAAIGPSIGPCCYEVSPELAEDFAKNFKTFGVERIVPKHRHLDLAALQEAELKLAGIGAVEIIRACTRCARDSQGQPLLHSYRVEGSGVRQWSVIERIRE